MISAKIKNQTIQRISQCDIFQDLTIIEKFNKENDKISVQYIKFPLIICLNQDCDLNSDFRERNNGNNSNKDCRLFHLIVAPLFNIDSFKQGQHWGGIFDTGRGISLNRTEGQKIVNNEDPRYHYLHFDDKCTSPDLIIDFKHFFTINTEYMYDNINKRVCSLRELYREKISQRFAFYQSRIGLPDK